MMRNIITILAISLASCVGAKEPVESLAQDGQKRDLEVTVYMNNMAFVKDTRELELPSGETELRFSHVPRTLIAPSVFLRSLNRPQDLRVLEQNYESDVISRQRLLKQYIGKKIRLLHHNEYQDRKELVEATLLSTEGGGIYEINGEIYLGHPGSHVLPEAPDGLLLEPSLAWVIDVARSETHDLELSYLTRQMTWNADYVMILDEDDGRAKLKAWATVNNNSGVDFDSAQLKLVAGNVNQVSQARPMYKRSAEMYMAADSAAPIAQEESFAGYHLFNVSRRTNLQADASKQILLFNSDSVEFAKEYIVFSNQGYYTHKLGGEPREIPVHMRVEFQNDVANGLGDPFPAGIVRLYQPDSQGKLQFIGEDNVGHTPEDEDIKIDVGQAFDLVCERRQVDYVQRSNRLHESEWEITLRNQQADSALISVRESLHGNWEIQSATHKYTKADANTLQFDVTVDPDQEVKIRYRVRIGI